LPPDANSRCRFRHAAEIQLQSQLRGASGITGPQLSNCSGPWLESVESVACSEHVLNSLCGLQKGPTSESQTEPLCFRNLGVAVACARHPRQRLLYRDDLTNVASDRY
jgi:hypothetical protein